MTSVLRKSVQQERSRLIVYEVQIRNLRLSIPYYYTQNPLLTKGIRAWLDGGSRSA